MKKICIILGLLIVSLYAHSVTRYLAAGTTDQTATFQNLVNQSVTGDIIIVRSGDHYLSGTVNVNKNGITVRGENGNVIRKSGNVSCIDANCSNSTFDNLYIDGGNRPEPCMRVFGNYNLILNSTFRNSGNSGLLIHNCNHNTIQGCKAYYNYMVGISQWAHSDGTVRDCQMYENGAEGLTIDGGTHNCRVFNNWIHKNNLPHRGVGGIGIDWANGAWIYNNTIDFNGYDGIKFQNNLVGGSDGCRIYENQNISYNEWCAVKFRLVQPVTNFGWWGNTCVGNPGGERCTTYAALSEQIILDAENVSAKAEIEVFPNPAQNVITISNAAEQAEARVFNMYGQLVLSQKLSGRSCNINIGNLAKGSYLVKITDTNNTAAVTKHILKE